MDSRKLSCCYSMSSEATTVGGVLQKLERKWKIPKKVQFVIFKPLSYCFKETIGFDVKASFASRL